MPRNPILLVDPLHYKIRSDRGNSSDMAILLGILVILDMGAVTVQDKDRTLRRRNGYALVLCSILALIFRPYKSRLLTMRIQGPSWVMSLGRSG